jgi:hypothetical protein
VVRVFGEADFTLRRVVEGIGLRHHRQRQGQRNEGQGGVFAKVHRQGSLKKRFPATLCRGMPDGMTMTLETTRQQDSVQQMTSRSLAGVAK